MTANELADDLNTKASMINLGEKIAWGSDSGIMDAAATMIRQQAAEIEAGIELVKKFQDEREALKAELAKYPQQGGSTPCKYTEGMQMNNEPVAIRYNFDGYGYQYMDSGSGSDWRTRVDGEPLYTCPSEHDLGIAEAIGFDKGYKAATVKELTDEEIEQLAKRKANQILMDLLMPDVGEPKKIDWNIGCTNQHLVNFARAILRKASEK